jgi:hypothetical protein
MKIKAHPASAILNLTIAVLFFGCHSTKVTTGGEIPRSMQYMDRQWFTIAGLVPLSKPAGKCAYGIRASTSQMSGTDFLIDLAMSITGVLTICDYADLKSTDLSCISAVSTLVPFLLSSRTVKYRCMGGTPTTLQIPTLAPPPLQDPINRYPDLDSR